MSGKTRVNVSLSNELLEKVDFLAKSYGCTRASMCAFFIGQGCTSTLKAFEAFDKVLEGSIANNQAEDTGN